MIRMEYPKANIEGLSTEEKVIAVKRQLDMLTNNVQLVLESINGDLEGIIEYIGGVPDEGVDTVTSVVDRVDAVEKTVGDIEDYIIEEGTDGIWTYRKWNSGIAECWGYTAGTTTAMTTKYGNMYYGALKTQAFPTGLFTSAPSLVQVQAYDNGNGTYTSIQTWTKDNVTYYPYAVLSHSISVGFIFNIKGRWK